MMRTFFVALVPVALMLHGCGSAGSETTTTDTTTTAGSVTTTTDTTTTAGSVTTTTDTTTTTTTTSSSIPAPLVPTEKCLCIFDIDRTLTGKQLDTQDCPKNLIKQGVVDLAYRGGSESWLTISEMTQRVQESFCAKCYHGICSAGTPSGKTSEERTVLLNALGGQNYTLSTVWSDAKTQVTSALALGAPHGRKDLTVRQIVDWVRSQGVDVADQDVHFFDDDPANVQPFADTKFNALQVSCASRGIDPNHPGSDIGKCGGTLAGIQNVSGMQLCQESVSQMV